MRRVFNTFKQLDEQVFFHSQSNGRIQILESGKEIAWLVKEDKGYLLKEETVLSYDLLENILTVRRKLQSNYYLILFFQNGYFQANLCFQQRGGGYKESFQEFIFASSKGHSIKEALVHLEKKLKNENIPIEDFVEDKIVNLSLVRKRINKIIDERERDLYEKRNCKRKN